MNLTDEEIVELENLLKMREIDQARKDIRMFAKHCSPPGWTFDKGFHSVYYQILEKFAKKQIKRLIITVPPQHGKSEGSTRLLPAFIFGLNPSCKMAIVSYAKTQASRFNRSIQQTIDDDPYQRIFPYVKLARSKQNLNKKQSEVQTSSEFSISGFGGSLMSIGRGGGLTGNPVDVLIMDDLYKDYEEGSSPVIRESVIDFYKSVASTRLHNHSQELIVFTRWHPDDLIGFIERKQTVIQINSLKDLDDLPPNAWVKVNFEAIKTGEPTELDPRKKGEALFPERHSAEKLQSNRELDADLFNCMYQGNPVGTAGLMYPKQFKTYNELPELRMIKNYTDTAEGGNDYLCSITYGIPLNENDPHTYVIDIIYTNEGPETTILKVAKMLNQYFVSEADIESNSGGKAFARSVEDYAKYTLINEFYQNKNKEARVFTNKGKVNELIVFPKNWDSRYSDFYDHITKFRKKFKSNKNDDGADVLTGIIEKRNDEMTFSAEIHNE